MLDVPESNKLQALFLFAIFYYLSCHSNGRLLYIAHTLLYGLHKHLKNRMFLCYGAGVQLTQSSHFLGKGHVKLWPVALSPYILG